MFETINKLSIKAYSGCNLHCCYCISGDTQITMSDLTVKPIKDIKIGDEIVAFNEISEKNKQRKLKIAKVTHVFEPRYVEKLYQINTKLGNKLLITGEHPILDGRNKWTTAEKLINKKEKKIKSVKLPKFNIRIDDIKSIKEIDFNDYVYNIETTEHTYIANNILVHNCHQLGEYKYHAQEFQDFENLEKLLMILPFEDRVDVTITGGEITLRPDCFMNVAKVFKKVERIRDVKFELCVVTNGTNMDVVYDWCDRKIICPHKTAISWDGIYSASKSRLTKGKYNDEFFKNVIKKLGTTKYNHDICVTPAITPMTLPDLAESYKFCLENNVFNFGYYFIHEANYHGVEFANEFRKQLTEIAKLYLEYSNKGEELYYYNWQLIYTKRKMPKNFFLCSKLGNNYHIDINGDIYPCIYFGDHKTFKVGSLTDGINEEKLKQFEKEFLVLPLCNHRKCGNLQCTECPASNLVHNKSLSKRFCNLCSILPIETQIYDEYASQISSLFKHDSLYIPKDEYMRGSKMFDNLHLEENAVFHTETGINSPAYNGVRKW